MTRSTHLPARLVWVMAAAAGLSAGNLYYAQPLLDSMSRELGVSHASIGLVVTLTQLGYALGLILLVPLGDLLERRRLVVSVLMGTAAALVGVALSPTFAVLGVCSLAVGMTAVVAQIVVPFAASLAPDERRGRVVGTVMSGLLLGILLARVVSGVVGDLIGWRGMYWLASAVMVVLAAVLRWQLPQWQHEEGLRYSQLVRSIGTLVVEAPVLRRRAVYGAMVFACFSVLWTALTFLLSDPPYGYRESTIGSFGLVGIVGALGASATGRLADRGWTRALTVSGLLIVTASFGMLAPGRESLWALIAGIVLLDLGVQGVHITNQSVIYALRPDARSRITAVYMTTYFIGGAVGSATAASAFELGGWLAVCALGAAFGAIALVFWMTERPVSTP